MLSLKALGEGPFWLLLASGSDHPSLVFFSVHLHHIVKWTLLCLCLQISFLMRPPVFGFRARPNPIWPCLKMITSAESLGHARQHICRFWRLECGYLCVWRGTVLLTGPSNIKVKKYLQAAPWWPSWCLTHDGHWMHVFELNWSLFRMLLASCHQ